MGTRHWDVIVIGAGIAGLSAAQMLGRARRRTLVVDAGVPRNRFAAHMHGVLGHDGTAPADLLARGRAEAEAYGVDFLPGSVAVVEEGDGMVTVTLEDGTAETARAVIVATGLADDLPDIPGLAERWGAGVLHCPYCHGWEVRDRRLGVLLVSEQQLHQAQLVRQWSPDVVVFTHATGPLAPEVERRLRARGVEIVAEPVVEVIGDQPEVSGVRLQGGDTIAVGALFTMGMPRPLDDFLGPLALARTETSFGRFLAVDAMGRTSADRIWAAGNVVNAAANVPLSLGSGAMAGAAVNAALVAEEFDAAESRAVASSELAPADYWEQRYSDSERVWSGRPNITLVDVVATLSPGRSLDLGCGEGADTIWLATQGWDATGLDISPTAVRRAEIAAVAAGLDPSRVRFVAADLAEWDDGGTYDLVTASFLHSPVALDRVGALRRAAERVAPGGRLLIVSHGAPPPWAPAGHGRGHAFPTAAEEIADLGLADAEWITERAELRSREAVAPDGTRAELDDTVVQLRRRPTPA
ncbi:bifunctional NAD(P)/FAD-dependent oxidoreductase/class I SAM-dependent methyltransferase [Microbacterium sp. CFBP9034]|uniref:bifunctional NAD(P)/FAD-dependent oxidoreductase/class I SAM-dependent methyltransferase n=1 Tax=Microbacterium sp. CFBP9034 TaxID=3096540 RepID=UPI002A6A590D|nr:bifunctional NAD(P)/FAD-dependent oxidoreductase/class I SAM-dependent methyltransferase [Microbacterium sp. CFBP9034]MDY0910685.1 bifunctional NAD(P)/FAD-dependent oxidoreductase/class I SAM-dependent methyltransferase [Microbacterium sp. CFBP9034]